MKKFLLILGILVFADIFYIAYVNAGASLTINYKPFIREFTVESGMFYLFMGLYGALCGFLLTYAGNFSLKEKIKKLSRHAEKSSVKTEESSDKVTLLEAKIKTLETALKNALTKN